MPIYEYECGKCGVFEQSQRMSDAALIKCPTCRRKVRRLISSTSFQLKGTGWYVTDYARSGSKGGEAESKSESKSEPTSESKSESKSDATPATTGEPKPTAKVKAKPESKAGTTTPATTAS
jgi:putative FmdB family regulatory protein